MNQVVKLLLPHLRSIDLVAGWDSHRPRARLRLPPGDTEVLQRLFEISESNLESSGSAMKWTNANALEEEGLLGRISEQFRQ